MLEKLGGGWEEQSQSNASFGEHGQMGSEDKGTSTQLSGLGMVSALFSPKARGLGIH